MHSSVASVLQLVELQILKAGFKCLILKIIKVQSILINKHPLAVYLYSKSLCQQAHMPIISIIRQKEALSTANGTALLRCRTVSK